MAHKFGKTWWGASFLQALTNIDYSNRLGRGRTYARNGSVQKITTKSNKIVAKVKGSRPSPYTVKVTVPLFSDDEKQELINAILGNPLVLSHLLNRQLPKELHELALDKGIAIFPETWEDFKMNCTCPDWAVPCKHLAAVIYLISEEIDRNPFLIFELHGLDILDELTEAGLTLEETIKPLLFKSLPISKPIVNKEPNTEVETVFDLSTITPQAQGLLSLLDPTPIFYHQKFDVVLKKQYRAVQRTAKALLSKDISYFETPFFERIEKLQIKIHPVNLNLVNVHWDGDLNSSQELNAFSSADDLKSIMYFIERIPKKYEDRLCQDLKVVHSAYQLSLQLALNGAFVPQLLDFELNRYKIRWIPAMMNQQVKDLVKQLENQVSQDCIVVQIGDINSEGSFKYLSPRDQIMVLLSLFLTYFMEISSVSIQFIDRKATTLDSKIRSLFFLAEVVYFSKLSEKDVPFSVHQYLQRFYIGEQTYTPLLKVIDNPDTQTFAIEIWVENKADAVAKPVSLQKFATLKKYQKYRVSLFQSLANLSADFEAIESVISSLGKEKLALDGDEFAHFLQETLPILKLLGIRILLDKSLKDLARPKASVRLDQKGSKSEGASYLNFQDLVTFDWQIALGNQMVSVSEFKKLVKNTSGVVNIKGEYILVDQQQIQTLLKNLENPKDLTASELLQAALTEEYQEAKISISSKAQTIIKELIESEAKPYPETLKATLRPYQERGYQWLYKNSSVGFGSILADDMGLGKTLQVITLLLQFKQEGRLEKKKGLVVVPTTLLTNWQKEIEKFAPDLISYVYHGTKRQLPTAKTPYDVFITTYGLLRSDATKLQKMKWEVFAIDEAQAIKNAGTAQTKAVKKIKASVKIAMSGTPVENRLSEYWSIFDFTNKGYLGSSKFFTKNFANPIENSRDMQQLDRFKKMTDPFILRRVKTDKSIISDLPDKIEQDCVVQLATKQTALYQNVVNQMLKSLEATEENSIERKGLVLKMITALKQVCNHPSQFLKKEDYSPNLSGKSERLLALLESIEERNEKVLIFTQYREMGTILSHMISETFKTQPLFLHGGVSRKKRDEMVEDFQNKAHHKIFILSIKAGGTGLNLTAANHVIHYDLWWNPAVEAQATDRAFRIGQQKNVLVHRLICKGTFEERINTMLQDKKKLADLTVASGEKWIGDLSNDELKDLIS